jgi:hypothetical protein
MMATSVKIQMSMAKPATAATSRARGRVRNQGEHGGRVRTPGDDAQNEPQTDERREPCPRQPRSRSPSLTGEWLDRPH